MHQRITAKHERMIVARYHRRAGCISHVCEDRRRAGVVAYVEECLVSDAKVNIWSINFPSDAEGKWSVRNCRCSIKYGPGSMDRWVVLAKGVGVPGYPETIKIVSGFAGTFRILCKERMSE